MDKIKNSKSKIKDLTLQKKLNMFYVEELEDRLEMSAIITEKALVNESCWSEDEINSAC